MTDEKQDKLATFDKDSEELEKVRVEDILGEKVSIEVRTLVVAPMRTSHLALGDVPSLIQAVGRDMKRIRALIWNESQISIQSDDRNDEIVYQPELRDSVALFFAKAETNERGLFGKPGDRIWKGDMEPVKFLRRDFLKFMKTHMTAFPSDVAESVKRLKFSEIMATEETLTDEESDNTRRVEDESRTTNVPTRFTAQMEIAEGFTADLEFETKVAKDRETYGRAPQTVILVRCINARRVLSDMMQGVLAQLPPGIPRFYGRLELGSGNR